MAQKFAGAKLYIGGNTVAPGSETVWTEIADVTGYSGSFGETWATADDSKLADIGNKSVKTTVDYGTITIAWKPKSGDAGQTALLAAVADGKSDAAYNFKVELADDKPSVGDNPTKIVFSAHATSATYGAAARGNLVDRQTTLDLQTKPTFTFAAA